MLIDIILGLIGWCFISVPVALLAGAFIGKCANESNDSDFDF